MTVSVSIAAKKLGISRGLAYSMVREKRIPALVFGHRIVIPKSALEELLKGQFKDVKPEDASSKSRDAPE